MYRVLRFVMHILKMNLCYNLMFEFKFLAFLGN